MRDGNRVYSFLLDGESSGRVMKMIDGMEMEMMNGMEMRISHQTNSCKRKLLWYQCKKLFWFLKAKEVNPLSKLIIYIWIIIEWIDDGFTITDYLNI